MKEIAHRCNDDAANRIGLLSLIQSTGLTFGRQLLAAFLQLATVLIVARSLGTAATGSYATALILPTVLAQIVSFGLPLSNVYFIASGKVQLADAYCSLRVAVGAQILLGLFVGIGVAYFFGDVFFPEIALEVLLLALCVFPFNLVNAIVVSLFQALQEFRKFNIVTLAGPLMTMATTIFMLINSSLSLTTSLIAVLAGQCVATCYGLLALRSHINLLTPSRPTSNYVATALRYGYKAQLSNIAGFLNYRIDLILVNMFVGVSAAGVYAVALRMVEQLYMFSQAASAVLLPRLSSVVHRLDSRTVDSNPTPFFTRNVLWLTAAVSLPLCLLGDIVTAWLFGPEFRGAGAVLAILLPGVVFKSGARIMANDLAARGMVNLNLLLGVCMLLLNIAGNMFLIPKFGLGGAAAATSFSGCLILAIRLMIQPAILGIHWSLFVWPPFKWTRRVSG